LCTYSLFFLDSITLVTHTKQCKNIIPWQPKYNDSLLLSSDLLHLLKVNSTNDLSSKNFIGINNRQNITVSNHFVVVHIPIPILWLFKGFPAFWSKWLFNTINDDDFWKSNAHHFLWYVYIYIYIYIYLQSGW